MLSLVARRGGKPGAAASNENAKSGPPVAAFAARLASDRRGGVAIIFALMAIVLCLFVGAAVDFGRWTHARQQTIAAMDAAVLAGGRVLQLDGTNVSGAITAAKAFYTENTKGRLPLLSDTITFTAVENNTSFTAAGNAFIETPLLSFVNITQLPLLDTSGADHSKAKIQMGGSSGEGVEIALMLDVTGSMAGTKVADMKAAATDLVNIVLSNAQQTASTKVSLVPFSEAVRLPSSANSLARGIPVVSKTVSYLCALWPVSTLCNLTVKLSPCVVERTGTQKYTDAAPAAGTYVTSLYTSNGTCPLDAKNELLPLTNVKQTLIDRIAQLKEAGGTAGQIGTAWAWYTLSPSFNTLWPSNAAGSYGNANVRKIAILMTDGEYNTEYDAAGIRIGNTGAGSAANGTSTTQARALCAAMKTSGITIYTVGFDLGGNATAIETLGPNRCATDSGKFFNTDNGEQLKQAFRSIALEISQLHLTQ